MAELKPTAVETEHGGASLDLLYRQHRAWLLRLVRRKFGSEQAEDIVQETFIRASSYVSAGIRSPRALLDQIATRAAIDQERRRAARPPFHDLSDQDVGGAETQSAELALKQVILSLPAPLREVFLLSRFGGLSYDEIAEHCGIAVKTVEWRMTRALKRIADQLRA